MFFKLIAFLLLNTGTSFFLGCKHHDNSSALLDDSILISQSLEDAIRNADTISFVESHTSPISRLNFNVFISKQSDCTDNPDIDQVDPGQVEQFKKHVLLSLDDGTANLIAIDPKTFTEVFKGIKTVDIVIELGADLSCAGATVMDIPLGSRKNEKLKNRYVLQLGHQGYRDELSDGFSTIILHEFSHIIFRSLNFVRVGVRNHPLEEALADMVGRAATGFGPIVGKDLHYEVRQEIERRVAEPESNDPFEALRRKTDLRLLQDMQGGFRNFTIRRKFNEIYEDPEEHLISLPFNHLLFELGKSLGNIQVFNAVFRSFVSGESVLTADVYESLVPILNRNFPNSIEELLQDLEWRAPVNTEVDFTVLQKRDSNGYQFNIAIDTNLLAGEVKNFFIDYYQGSKHWITYVDYLELYDPTLLIRKVEDCMSNDSSCRCFDEKSKAEFRIVFLNRDKMVSTAPGKGAASLIEPGCYRLDFE